ncbi:hypothetical protein HYPSUDRAFT_40532 [Hypholoma sublateritium FD-334 SS-4]|uniref:Uncharacterized protein n=1 Tax=Hypholoma sublateritium (strain FD-334 SS-4) TaxID=945553 RepID=A0A0D2L6X0_HYPSF|nr:hypothetical protein HYPSUDRAFT_40532 [Hypholoma sublateritium FD-334 SS-4]
MSQLCIMDLPNEIVARIFYAGTQFWSDGRVEALPFPLLVSAVCSHWKLLAVDTPELWAFIAPPLHKSADACLLHTSKWLARSGGMFLSIVLDSRPSHLAFPLRERQKTSSLIAETLHLVANAARGRLRRLDIFDRVNTVVLSRLQSLYDAPNLQQLSLCFIAFDPPFSSFGSDDNTAMVAPWVCSLPNLTKLRLMGLCLPYIRTLTTLNAVGFRLSYNDAQALFSTSPNLSSLQFDQLPVLSSPLPDRFSMINAHSVRSIVVISEPLITGAVYLFEILSLPNLTRLELNGTGAVSVSSVFGPSLSGTKIQTLRITCSQAWLLFSSRKNEDIKILHSLSTLENLQIIHGPIQILSRSGNIPHSRARTRSITIRAERPAAHLMTGKAIEAARIALDSSNDFQPLEDRKNTMPWPDLRTIRLDSLLATDVASLCEFVAHHKGLRTVELSYSAMRHLSGSLRRTGDHVYALPWRAANMSILKEGSKDVQEWLANRVALIMINSSDEHERLNERGDNISLSGI